MTEPTEALLGEQALAEIEARLPVIAVDDAGICVHRVQLSPAERDALCQSPRVAWQQIEKQLASYNDEVDEFNAGFQAYKDSLPDDTPRDDPHDVWLCGYAWAAYEDLKRDAKAAVALREQLAEEQRRNQIQADSIMELEADVTSLKAQLAQVEKDRELCLQVQKRGEHSSVTCPCIVAVERGTMTEQIVNSDERLKEIRERQRTRPVEAVEDIEFLLSLVGSQRAGGNLSDAQALLASFEFNGDVQNVSRGHCPECWNFPDKPTTAKVWRERNRVGHKPDCKRAARFRNAYTVVLYRRGVAARMREACVRKVREMRDEWQQKHSQSTNDAELVDRLVLEGDIRVADQIITAIESVEL